MKKENKQLPRQIIWSILITFIVFGLASQLKGSSSYQEKLTGRFLLQSHISEISSLTLDKKVQFKISGLKEHEEYFANDVLPGSGLSVDPDAEDLLSVNFQKLNGDLSCSAKLSRNNQNLYQQELHRPLGTWISLLPPLLAIILAICLRRVLLALGLSIWLGASLKVGWVPWVSLWYGAKEYVWGNFVGEFSLTILGFVFVLVGTVNVINRGGGMAGVIQQISKIAKCARTACLSTTALGTLIFFDDYTNTIVVGNSMRSFTDKMKVSREKLAYLVDSTTAPLAGLALISTWIGFEVYQMQSVADFLSVKESGYSLFLQALPYRFYCIFALAFVYMVSIVRRDFGPMLHAERRAFQTGRVDEEDTNESADSMIAASEPKEGVKERWYNAFLPIISLIVFLLVGIIWRGSSLIDPGIQAEYGFGFEWLKACFSIIGADGNSLFLMMFGASLFSFFVAVLLFMSQGILSLSEILLSFLSSWKILPAAVILVLAWSIREVCDDLGTAMFLTSLVSDLLNPHMIPLAIFLLAAAVSFATGTSFGAMGLLLPIAGPLAYTMGDPFIFVISLAAVLDGAIFGDHCSPISDTTVLSALSSSCDLVDHVKTQMPYALLCMLVAGLVGYLPAAFGVNVWILILTGTIVLGGVLWIFGKNPEK